ncbi:FecR family protein [Mesonia maritima]|uniref:Ferric-dicitrate binding protein FerR (Iron transport regulator) n=1 Tax=Mesonia maritima TaxID=1793873 RepID=A0ABU1K8I4_9FLAO|nr:FecR family protein [Mesonia maritima]MDR6301570.1 ferric-dicitrate binding protein FerR (iron transport regulator) [Mesonia maritima]
MDESEKEIEKKLKKIWKEKPEQQLEEKALSSWENFSADTFNKKNKTIKPWHYAAAAVLLIFICLSSFLVFNTPINSQSTIADNFNIIENPSSQIKRLYLPDSSLVELEPHSKLKFTHDFRKNRKVHLTGEAYFKVQKNENYPFQVFCKKTTTTVLGTEFTVKEDTNHTISIKLYEGKVQMNVKDSLHNWILSPGEKFIYNKNKLAVEVFKNFKDFNNQPLSSVINYIQENYHYKLTVPKKLLQKKITLRIREKEELSNITNILAEIYNLKPHIDEDLREIVLN